MEVPSRTANLMSRKRARVMLLNMYQDGIELSSDSEGEWHSPRCIRWANGDNECSPDNAFRAVPRKLLQILHWRISSSKDGFQSLERKLGESFAQKFWVIANCERASLEGKSEIQVPEDETWCSFVRCLTRNPCQGWLTRTRLAYRSFGRPASSWIFRRILQANHLSESFESFF